MRVLRAANGFTLTTDTGEVQVFEGEVGALQSLLWSIVEELGAGGSRYDQERLSIGAKHGDKYDCSGCEICT